MTIIYMVSMETNRTEDDRMEMNPVVREYDAKETPKMYKFKSEYGYSMTLFKTDPRIALTREGAIEKFVRKWERRVQSAWEQWSDAQDGLAKARKLRDGG